MGNLRGFFEDKSPFYIWKLMAWVNNYPKFSSLIKNYVRNSLDNYAQ